MGRITRKDPYKITRIDSIYGIIESRGRYSVGLWLSPGWLPMEASYDSKDAAMRQISHLRQAQIAQRRELHVNPVEEVKIKADVHSSTEGKSVPFLKRGGQKKAQKPFQEELKEEEQKRVKNPVSTRRGVPLELGSKWTEEKIKPKEYFDPQSFRYTRVPKVGKLKAFVLVGCKRGHWDARTNSCRVGTETHVIFRPKSGIVKSAENPRVGQQVSLWRQK